MNSMTAAPRPSLSHEARADEDAFVVPPGASDEALADLIDRDVADRLVQGLAVSLERYLPSIGETARHPLSLDAAVDGALRALMASGNSLADSVQHLCASHPNLRRVVESTATITMLFGPSGATIETLPSVADRAVPSRFGRPLPDGRGRYELIEPLGGRTPARVFRAVDHFLSRAGGTVEVVVKILGRAGDQAQLDDAIEEARLLRAIRHEAIVDLVDSGVSDDSEVYLVTELVHGESLRERVQRLGRPTPVGAARMIATLAHAVGMAHRAGVIHCDLSPGNILVDSEGRPRLVDFGSAVHAGITAPAVRALRGTPGFMAPEQADSGSPAAPTLDVHSFGALLFWLLTGSSANGRDAAEIDSYLRGRADLRPWRTELLLQSQVPRDLCRLVLAAIDRDPARRPLDAEMLARRLDAWLADHARSQLPWSERVVAWGRHRPRSAVAMVVTVTALVTLVATTAITQWQSEPRRSVEYSLMAARADRAVAYGLSRYDRSLRVDREEARALLARVPQILGTTRVPAASMREWMSGPDGARLASLLAGLQVISQRHDEGGGVESFTLRAALGALMLAQARDPSPALRGGADLMAILPPGDPVRSVAEGVERAAVARSIGDALRGARARPGLPSPENALVELDAAIREQRREEREVIATLLQEQRDRLAAAMAERPTPQEASGESTAGAGARRPD